MHTPEQAIGLLHQWLNEDRITDPSKLVTDENIEHWLEPLIQEAEAGRKLAERLRDMDWGDLKKHTKGSIANDVMTTDIYHAIVDGKNDQNRIWRNLRDAALAAYDEATRKDE